MMLKKLYIEPTSKCNFNCKMCFRNTWFDENFCDMSYDMFLQIVDGIPFGVQTIFFGGMGEPLFHKDILNMIQVCKEKGYKVELLTNGSLLTKKMCETLIHLRLDKLWVSLDSFQIDSDHKPQELGHPNTATIIQNIKTLNSCRYFLKSTMELGITFVVSKTNVDQLQHIPLFLDQYLVNDINISNMYPSSQNDMDDVLYKKTLALSIGSDKFGSTRPRVNIPYMDFDDEHVVAGLAGLFKKMNFNLSIGNIEVPRRSQYCRFVEEGMCFVRSDGNVSPCMALLHNGTTAILESTRTIHHHSFGSINDDTIENIWNSDDYTTFRNRVKNFEFSPCTNCGHCDFPESNLEDCFGNVKPTCGACLWAEGVLSCP